MESGEVRRVVYVTSMGERKMHNRASVRKPEYMEPLGICKGRWKDNIKMYLQEIKWECLECVIPDKHRILWKCYKILTTWGTLSLLWCSECLLKLQLADNAHSKEVTASTVHSSFLYALPIVQPTLTRRTFSHCLVDFQNAKFVSPRNNSKFSAYDCSSPFSFCPSS